MKINEDILQGVSFKNDSKENCSISNIPSIEFIQNQKSSFDPNGFSLIKPEVKTENLTITAGSTVVFSLRWSNACLPEDGMPKIYFLFK